MDTVRSMNKVQRIAWEKPLIKGTRHSCNETCAGIVALLFLECLLEQWKGLENGVEVIPWKVIQEHIELRQAAAQLATSRQWRLLSL